MKARGHPLDTIECPNCGHAIPMSEALSHQVAERARAESRAEIDRLQNSLTRKETELQQRERNVDAAVQERVAVEASRIEKEVQRAAQRQWAKREKQIEQVISNTAGMYGELQALTGLPDLPALAAGTHEPEGFGERDAIVVRLPSRELPL
jgi:hypothetical protein